MSPTFLSFHGQYWAATDTNAVPVITAGRGGYPLWQSTAIAPVGLGMISAWWDGFKDRWRWWWHVVRQIRALSPRRRALVYRLVDGLQWEPPPRLLVSVGADMQPASHVPPLAPADQARELELILERALHTVQHPVYPLAARAVRQTATTLGFNKPQAWIQLGHALKDHPDWAENTWRHLHACELTDQWARQAGSTLTNPDRHLLVQIAYSGFSARGK